MTCDPIKAAHLIALGPESEVKQLMREDPDAAYTALLAYRVRFAQVERMLREVKNKRGVAGKAWR